MGKVVVVVAVAVVVLVGGAWLSGRRGGELPEARWQLGEALGEEGAEGFARADGPRAFDFPADHGPHPDFRLEWWYFTGNLEAEDGRRFGYQLTFFRRAIEPPDTAPGAPTGDGSEDGAAGAPPAAGRAEDTAGGVDRASGRPASPVRGGAAHGAAREEPAAAASAWRTRQVYLAHFAVTDAAGRRFRAFEEMARGAAGLAGAQAEPFSVWVKGWRAERADDGPASLGESIGGGSQGGAGRAAADLAPELVNRSPAVASRFPGVARQARERSSGVYVELSQRSERRSGADGAGRRSIHELPAPPSDPAANRAAGGIFPLRLAAAAEGVAVDLALATAKPPVLQGEAGLSVKGPGAGNASYYYSLTRLPTGGTLTVDGERFAVTGLSWLDREWSTTLLGPGERGWDWLALQLDDGRELTGWRIRRPGSPPDRLDSLTLVGRDGTPRSLDPARHRLLASSPWTSPAGTRYPTAWRLAGPDLDLAVQALLPAQELRLSIRYWEGAVTARGEVGGSRVTGHGYVEMTGYEE